MKTKILTLGIVFSFFLGISQNKISSTENESSNDLPTQVINQEKVTKLLQDYNANTDQNVSLEIDTFGYTVFLIRIKWRGNASMSVRKYQSERATTRLNFMEYHNLVQWVGSSASDTEFWVFHLTDDDDRTGQVIKGAIEKDQSVEEDSGD